MLCKSCKDKPIARGIKNITCRKCERKFTVNAAFSNICERCSDKLNICQRCGKTINFERDIGFIIEVYKDMLKNANMEDLDKRTLITEFIEILEDIK